MRGDPQAGRDTDLPESYLENRIPKKISGRKPGSMKAFRQTVRRHPERNKPRKEKKSVQPATLDRWRRQERQRREGPACRRRLSKKEHRADALALGADERRDKLRKAAGSGRYAKIRRCLNGETHAGKACVSVPESIGCGGEPGELKHLSSRRKRKQK